jgi:K+ transporter
MTRITPETVQQMWIASLVIYAVVLVVVAALLTLILRTARDIRAGVSAIWTVGQRVANNTIHIALLDGVNHTAAQILAGAGGIVGATASIKGHAEGCAGCPACVLGR